MAFQQGAFSGGEGFPEFSVRDLHEATGGFHHMCVIGEGGFGKVYRAMVNCTPVAIKASRRQGVDACGALRCSRGSADANGSSYVCALEPR